MHASISASVKFESPTKRTLPARDDVVERGHRLLERRVPVGPVHQVHVDVVGAEVLQALVDRREHRSRLLSRRFGLSLVVHAELRDDDRLVAPRARAPCPSARSDAPMP